MAKRVSKPLKASMPLDVWPERAAYAQGLRHAGLKVPRVFSLIANPNESLGALTTLRRVLGLRELLTLDFDHRQCELLDLCASVVNDVLIIKARRQAGFRARKLRVRGNLPENDRVKAMLASSGIMKQLGVRSLDRLPTDVRQRLKVSDLRVGCPSPPHATSAIELAASDLAEFFDDCLKSERDQLKPTIKSNLIQLITEVLDNAEEHGRGEKQWYTIGHYNQHENPAEGGECHLVIFNFGDSIYESLKRPDTSEELIRQIRDLAYEHRRRGYFVIGSGGSGFLPIWDEESLWTLYALQEGVSRFSNRPEGVDRGNGTVKMMEFFTELASGLPQMALLSGRTHILFDGRYRLQPKDFNGGSRKVIAFNEANDLKERPDERYVRTLTHNFPGTLMSLRFHLRQVDLAKIKERVDSDDEDH